MQPTRNHPRESAPALVTTLRKEEIKDEAGRTLVRVNISYFRMCGDTADRDHFSGIQARFNGFYESISSAFYRFATRKLAAFARRHPGRLPCGAVLRTRAELRENALAVVLEASVFDGENALPPFRTERVWQMDSPALSPLSIPEK